MIANTMSIFTRLITRRLFTSKPFTPDVKSFIRFIDENGQIKYGEPVDKHPSIDSYAYEIPTTNIFDTPLIKNEKLLKIKSFLSPIDSPSIICVGKNYIGHCEETKTDPPSYPVIFMKNPSSLTGHLCDVIIPEVCSKKPEVDFEGELAVIIGKKCKDVKRNEVDDVILGYTCSQDISARRWQGFKRQNGQWCRAKSFDTFAPIGPKVILDKLKNINNLSLKTLLNNEIMQSTTFDKMIWSVHDLIEFISQDTTLLPGTIILTGTPDGVGFTRNPPIYMKDGDVLTVDIEKVGVLTTYIKNKN